MVTTHIPWVLHIHLDSFAPSSVLKHTHSETPDGSRVAKRSRYITPSSVVGTRRESVCVYFISRSLDIFNKVIQWWIFCIQVLGTCWYFSVYIQYIDIYIEGKPHTVACVWLRIGHCTWKGGPYVCPYAAVTVLWYICEENIVQWILQRVERDLGYTCVASHNQLIIILKKY